MLSKRVAETANDLGISDLVEKLYAAVSASDGVCGVTFAFSEWEPDWPCIKIIVRHHLSPDHSLRERLHIVRPVEKIIRACGLLQAQGYNRYDMDKEHLIFYYRTKTEDDYTLYASDFSSFVPTAGELQQLRERFKDYDGDKETFLHDFQVQSWKHNFFDERGKEIARLQDQLSEKDRRIAELEAALEKAQNK